MRRFSRFGLPTGGLISLVLFVAACSAAIAFSSPDPGRAAPPLRDPQQAARRTPDLREVWPYTPAGPVALPKTPGPGVADLLAHPPAAGELVEVDAYFSGAGLVPHLRPSASADQVACPSNWEAALTDRPFLGLLGILNGVHSNVLPDDGPWLIAARPEAIWPGVQPVPDLPYHARLRGYLGDPAFSHCASPWRIFVVVEVVKVYAEAPAATPGCDLPDDYASWPRHHEAGAGYSLPYPPGWLVERLDGATLALRAPQWPDYPIIVRLHAGETHHDPYDPAAAPLLAGDSFGVHEQGLAFDGLANSQRLVGYQVVRHTLPRRRAISVLFSAHGYTYELALRYPLGFDALQPLLTAYSAIVEGFRLDRLPGPSPTPPVQQTLGAGPFLGEEEALACVSGLYGQQMELVEAQLVPEAAARDMARQCSAYAGHSAGVWVLTVHVDLVGERRLLRLFLDAVTGEPLCREVADPGAADSRPGS